MILREDAWPLVQLEGFGKSGQGSQSFAARPSSRRSGLASTEICINQMDQAANRTLFDFAGIKIAPDHLKGSLTRRGLDEEDERPAVCAAHKAEWTTP
ncbi:protein of unknown function [Methylocella tundrae]|uniref:Uncharacterized protein n=1 Tax=Methylocella tundrae TaxID=227605 RepID=A0A4U8Z4X2_METTU|nr:protein of unknown function [Methylocella tundrae]